MFGLTVTLQYPTAPDDCPYISIVVVVSSVTGKAITSSVLGLVWTPYNNRCLQQKNKLSIPRLPTMQISINTTTFKSLKKLFGKKVRTIIVVF